MTGCRFLFGCIRIPSCAGMMGFLNVRMPQMPSERLQTAFFTQFPPFPILLDTL
ncbi:hypothetical protein NMA510612_2278 [Neisseria meningitidis]|uniref:Uncharacterized protein n=1 Tax=Neisseria meningitidis TaxID=487 RepID=X5EU01_NEIME|nr:hypothetical protein NMA510612_2278 [Neisseria meningitidis]